MSRETRILQVVLIVALIPPPSTGAVDYQLRETLTPVPIDHRNLVGVEDLDGDGALDVVVHSWWTGNTYKILERVGSTLVERATFSDDQRVIRGVAVADVDGDGRGEIISANYRRVTIREATSNDTYAVIHQETLGNYIESTEATFRVGDSDGDGRREFLIPRESFPSRLYMLEGTANDTYARLGPLEGGGGNAGAAGAMDLDGDSVPDSVFFDDDSYSMDWGHTFVFENGLLVFDTLDFSARVLGDTDGNGKLEMIGPTSDWDSDTIIFENTGDNAYAEVFRESRGYRAADLTYDGRTELFRPTLGANLVGNVLTMWTRVGGDLEEIWNSGTMFQDDDVAINWIGVLAIGDTDGDGKPELAVLQGTELHILEMKTRLDVLIDIKPGGHPNPINRKSKGLIPVAILSTEEFDAPAEVDRESLFFGRTGEEDSLARTGSDEPKCHGKDVTPTDGLEDLVCHFHTPIAGFQCGDTEGHLTGQLLDQTAIAGSDSVVVVPCR